MTTCRHAFNAKREPQHSVRCFGELKVKFLEKVSVSNATTYYMMIF